MKIAADVHKVFWIDGLAEDEKYNSRTKRHDWISKQGYTKKTGVKDHCNEGSIIWTSEGLAPDDIKAIELVASPPEATLRGNPNKIRK